jgi:hypothetical protein
MQGSIEGENYGEDDPDCWWTWSKCTNSKAPGIPPDVAIMPEVCASHRSDAFSDPTLATDTWIWVRRRSQLFSQLLLRLPSEREPESQ